jgi:hypothetical protein
MTGAVIKPLVFPALPDGGRPAGCSSSVLTRKRAHQQAGCRAETLRKNLDVTPANHRSNASCPSGCRSIEPRCFATSLRAGVIG